MKKQPSIELLRALMLVAVGLFAYQFIVSVLDAMWSQSFISFGVATVCAGVLFIPRVLLAQVAATEGEPEVVALLSRRSKLLIAVGGAALVVGYAIRVWA